MVIRKSPITIRVSLLRFFSIIVVPEKVLPIPPPKVVESPPPFPEWRSMSAIRVMENIVWKNATT